MQPTLEAYFREFDGKAIDFDIRVLQSSDSGVEFIIHPRGVDGRTANFFVRSELVQLVAITNPPEEPQPEA